MFQPRTVTPTSLVSVAIIKKLCSLHDPHDSTAFMDHSLPYSILPHPPPRHHQFIVVFLYLFAPAPHLLFRREAPSILLICMLECLSNGIYRSHLTPFYFTHDDKSLLILSCKYKNCKLQIFWKMFFFGKIYAELSSERKNPIFTIISSTEPIAKWWWTSIFFSNRKKYWCSSSLCNWFCWGNNSKDRIFSFRR